MFEIRPLLTTHFWFQNTPPPLLPSNERLLFAVFAVLLILGAIIRMVGSHRKEDRHVTEMFSRFGRLCVTIGLLGLLFFFFTYEQIPLLGSRFWFLALGLLAIIWFAMIVHYVVKVVPVERSHEAAQKEKEKYLPKRKE